MNPLLSTPLHAALQQLRALSNLLFPRYCAICGKRLTTNEMALCIACNWHLPRTYQHLTPRDNLLCRLYWRKVPIERAAAWFYYAAKSPVSKAIYTMKYHHRAVIGEQLGYMMAKEIAPEGFFDGVDCLIPVPLTPARKRQRGYNQSRCIAEGVARITGIPILDKVLIRTHFAGSQTKADVQMRQKNVQHAFQLTRPQAIKGRHVLLIDDVVTTGATTLACAKALAEAEGVVISVLALGVVKE